MSPRRQARSHGRRADVRAHRRDRVRLAGEDVALLEPPLGGEVEVAPAVGADGTGLLALDVALEPGRVHRLDEELLGLIEGHEADAPLAAGARAGRRKPPAGERRRPRENYQAATAPAQRQGAHPAHPRTAPRRGRSPGRRAAGRTAGRDGARAMPRSRLTRACGAATLARVLGARSRACQGRPVSPSEIAFLALGLVLGVALGAALLVVVRSRPPLRPRGARHDHAERDRAPRTAATRSRRRRTGCRNPPPARRTTRPGRNAAAGRAARGCRRRRRRSRAPNTRSIRSRHDPGVGGRDPDRAGTSATHAPAPSHPPWGRPPRSRACRRPGGGDGRVATARALAATLAAADEPAPRAVAVAVADPARPAAGQGAAVDPAPMRGRVDVGPSRPGLAVQARTPVPAVRPALADRVVGIPVHAGVAPDRPAAVSRPERTTGGAAAAAGGAGASAGATAPRQTPARIPERRLSSAAQRPTRARAPPVLPPTRCATRSGDTTSCEAQVEEAEAIVDPRRIDAEKARLHAEFRAGTTAPRARTTPRSRRASG